MKEQKVKVGDKVQTIKVQSLKAKKKQSAEEKSTPAEEPKT